MRKLSQRLFVVSLLFSILTAPLSSATASDFKREVIYQIITDRFFDGSSTNNNPVAELRTLRFNQNKLARLLGRRPCGHSTEDVLSRGHGRDCYLDLAAGR